MRSHIAIALVLVLATPAWAGPLDDAAQLKDEAMATLKANAAKTVPPQDYAMAIYRLEKAQSILEAVGENGGSLPQEVNSALFWARRCSNVNIVKELEKIHASNPPLKLASQTKRLRGAGKGARPGELDTQDEALQAFQDAESFANAHKDDDYMIALRFFQMANEFPGNDYAVKAMTLAAEAQMRFAIKNGATKEELPDAPEMAPVREADELVAQGELEKAFDKYKASIKLKETIIAHRRLGHAYFHRAQQMKDQVNAKFVEFAPQYKAAYEGAFTTEGRGGSARRIFNPANAGWMGAQKQLQALQVQGKDAMVRYLYAQWEFEAILKLAQGNKDFDAAAYAAMALSARMDNRTKSLDWLKKFLKDYEPANETERFIYEYCKTEFERISKG
jgi:hypothetical protein